MDVDECTILFKWVSDHALGGYVKVDALQDAILDLMKIVPAVEDIISPLFSDPLTN